MAFAPMALSLGSTGLAIMGGLTQAQGTAAGYQYQQDKAQRLKRSAITQAHETDAQLREELQQTLGNIQAIKAAANTDAASPTTLAVQGEETRISDRQRRIKVGNLMAQAEQYGRDAAYYGYAADQAMDVGYLNAFTAGIKGLAGLGKPA